MMRRRIFMALMLCAFILLPVQGTQASRQGARADASVVTLRFATYGFDPWSKIFPQMAAQFEKEHPTIKLQVIVTTWNTLYTKMQAEAMAHQGVPDVFIMDPSVLATLADRGILMPLDHFIMAHHMELSQFYANSIRDSRYNAATRTIGSGNLYALPLTNDQDELFFNKTAFDKAHLAYPRLGWTWDQVRTAAIRLTLDTHGRNPTQRGFDSKHIAQYGFNYAYDRQILEIIEDWGGAIIAPDYKSSVIDQPPAVKAITYLANLYKMHVIPLPGALSALADPFIAGKVAMSLDGDWQVDYYASTIKKFGWDIAPVPLGPRGTPYIIGDTNSWSMYAHTQHPNEAWELLSWLVGSEAMTKYAAQIGLPSLRSAASAWSNPTMKVPAHRYLITEYMRWTHNNQEGLHENEWRTAVGQNLDAVWLGKMSPEQGARTTAAAIDRILQSP